MPIFGGCKGRIVIGRQSAALHNRDGFLPVWTGFCVDQTGRTGDSFDPNRIVHQTRLGDVNERVGRAVDYLDG